MGRPLVVTRNMHSLQAGGEVEAVVSKEAEAEDALVDKEEATVVKANKDSKINNMANNMVNKMQEAEGVIAVEETTKIKNKGLVHAIIAATEATGQKNVAENRMT